MRSSTSRTRWTVGLKMVSVSTRADWGASVVARDIRTAAWGNAWGVHDRVGRISSVVRTVNNRAAWAETSLVNVGREASLRVLRVN
jgi:hypothetical protein